MKGMGAWVDGQVVELSPAAVVIEDRMYIPVRFAAENLGFRVHYFTDFGLCTRELDEGVLITDSDLVSGREEGVGDEERFRTVIGSDFAHYELLPGKETARRIAVGSSVDEVRQAYGIPLRDRVDEQGNGYLEYVQRESFQGYCEADFLVFVIKAGRVHRIGGGSYAGADLFKLD